MAVLVHRWIDAVRMEGFGAGVAVEQLALFAAYDAHFVDGVLEVKREKKNVNET